MANEFKVKKGLIVDGSNTVVDVQGTQGQLFSVTDSLTGDLFSVSDVSGVPIFNVNSSGRSTFDGVTSITSGGSASPSGEEGLHLMYDTNHAYIKAENNGVTNRPLTFTSSAYTFSAGNATFAGNLYLAEYIYHDGNPTTYARFQTNRLTLHSGGGAVVDLHSNGQLYFTGASTFYDNANFAGTITAAGGSSNNNDDANILTLNASQHARLLVDTSSTSGHRATLVLESNGNELTLSTTGSASELNSVGDLTVTSSATTFTGNVISKDTFYLENASGKRWQQLFDGSNSSFRYYNGSSWSTPTLKLYASGGIDVPYNGSVFGNQSASSGTTVLTLSSYEPHLVFKKGRDSGSGYDYFKIKAENDAMAVDFTTAHNGGSDNRTARITSNGRWVIGGYDEVNGAQLSVQGAFGATGDIETTSGKLNITSDGSAANGAEIYLKHANNNTTDTIGTIFFGNNADSTLSTIVTETNGANTTSNLKFRTSNSGTIGTVLTLNADKSASFTGLIQGTRTGSNEPSSSNANLYLIDSRSMTNDVGGSIVFGGIYNNSGDIISGGPYIKGYKENNTAGDYGFGLKFGVRENGSGGAGSPCLTLNSSGDATFGGGISMSDSILIDYTGSDGQNNDAGIKIMNDGSDWGMYIRKDSNANYGMRIDSGGANALSIYSTTGGSTKTFNVNGSNGNTDIAGTLTVDGDFTRTNRLSVTGDVNVIGATDLTIPQGRKIRFDSAGGHTYISEESDSNLKFYVAATEVANFTNDNINFNKNLSVNTSTTPRYQLDLAKINNAAQTDYLALGVNNGPSTGDGTDLGTGIVWKANYSGYSKRSAGIMQVAEGNYFRSGLAFYTNNATSTSSDWIQRMNLNMDGKLTLDGSDANVGTVLDVQGTAGQLFSVTNSLTGDLFSVSDISGMPILNVNSSGQVDIDGNLETGGIVDPTVKIKSLAGGDPTLIFDAQAANRSARIKFYDNGSNVGGFIDYLHNGDKMNFGAGSSTGVTMTVGDGIVSMGIDAYATAANAKLQLPSYALAIKNDVSGSDNNWSYIRNTGTGSSANVEITTGLGIAATFNHDKTTTFQGNIHTDVVNNKANSHNMIYRSGTNTLVGGGGLANKVYIDDNGHLTAGAKSDGTPSAYGGTGVKSINIQASDYPVLAFYSGATPTLKTTIIGYSTSTLFSHSHASAKFTFENSTAVQGELSGTGTLTVRGDVIAYGSPSDISLKENIKPIDNALDKVSKLKGVTFNWKESDSVLDIKEDIGFIAQDVQGVLPELVRENDNGKLSLRDKGIVPILVEAIKELKAEIEELKKHKCNCNGSSK